jgi:hypothetical protein
VFIFEFKRTQNPFWHSLLLVIYYPMLSHLRQNIWGRALEWKDLDQTIVEAFLAVMKRFPRHVKKGQTHVYMRQYTRRAVFFALEKQQKEERNREGLRKQVEEQHANECAVAHLLGGYSRPKTKSVERMLFSLTDGIIPRVRIQLLIDTTFQGFPLRDYVRRLCIPDAQVEEREYQRLKRQRLRTKKQIRALLNQCCFPGVEYELLDNYLGDPAENDPCDDPIDRTAQECFS